MALRAFLFFLAVTTVVSGVRFRKNFARVGAAPPQEIVKSLSKRDASDLMYVATYDYTAADEDEVSFKEGDIIIHGNPIDSGWLKGTVKRTGQRGMIPSNYVKRM